MISLVLVCCGLLACIIKVLRSHPHTIFKWNLRVIDIACSASSFSILISFTEIIELKCLLILIITI
jgi:hypothetical protein